MSRGSNQKLKLSYLTRIMLAKTDEEHGLTMPQIQAELERMGVTAERKSIYTDPVSQFLLRYFYRPVWKGYYVFSG
ncbi:MAG: hypothetical protein Q4B09_00015 [Lachnospiraceae bacterium]|nr:hypothetical protein [Lachnospiraceae bacterium]